MTQLDVNERDARNWLILDYMQVSFYPKFNPLELQLCFYMTNFDILGLGLDFEYSSRPGPGPGAKNQAWLQLSPVF